ncbi:DUF3667 domain-containing protein [Nonlabens antarcticus]|uniref:DUF3667 domain-containing protein n=1 Tax=Nonlabens antarcticus TaxID=392714 RepID=UPI001891AFF8|nr:DUF3667 domain-containing protein [Nonlabens antarcticus]
MERHCKNCDNMLYSGHTHCASCGAKWIENRITMRQVGTDFTDMYLGVDTKFVRTFVDLFRKPGVVINGYISGRRQYYVDAIRYTLLTILISGLYTFLMRSGGFFDVYLTEIQAMTPSGSESPEAQEFGTKFGLKMVNFIFDFQGLIHFTTIPLLALVGRITFWGKRYYNFTEHIVFYLYTYAHSMIVTTPITIILMYLSFDLYMYWSFSVFPAMFLYNAYCYKRCFNLDFQTTVLRSLISIIVLITILILAFLFLMIIIFLTALIASKLGFDVESFITG